MNQIYIICEISWSLRSASIGKLSNAVKVYLCIGGVCVFDKGGVDLRGLTPLSWKWSLL